MECFPRRLNIELMTRNEKRPSNMRIAYCWNDSNFSHTKCHGYRTLAHLIPNCYY